VDSSFQNLKISPGAKNGGGKEKKGRERVLRKRKKKKKKGGGRRGGPGASLGRIFIFFFCFVGRGERGTKREGKKDLEKKKERKGEPSCTPFSNDKGKEREKKKGLPDPHSPSAVLAPFLG